MNVKNEFGRRLSRLMTDKGMNQSDLARRANDRMPAGKEIRRDTINGYVHGRSIPGPLRLKAIAEALGADESDLLPDVREASREISIQAGADGNVSITIDTMVSMQTAAKIMGLIDDEKRSRHAMGGQRADY